VKKNNLLLEGGEERFFVVVERIVERDYKGDSTQK